MIMARARCRLGARRFSTNSRSSLCLFGAKLSIFRLWVAGLVLILYVGSEQASGVGFQPATVVLV